MVLVVSEKEEISIGSFGESKSRVVIGPLLMNMVSIVSEFDVLFTYSDDQNNICICILCMRCVQGKMHLVSKQIFASELKK